MKSFTLNGNQIEFHVWAPKLGSMEVVGLDDKLLATLQKNSEGVFTGTITAKLPLQYYFVIDGNRKLPDPCSEFLPVDVHGPSEIGSSDFPWSDHDWRGVDKSDLMIYELHLGTFSDDGTYEGCRRQLDYLCKLGVNAIEFLPLAQCPGRWNWGYDGVSFFAPNRNYGSVEDLKRLIDDCHGRGISVIHDVVYNHVGPEGNYLGAYGKYFSKKHGTPWGSAFDFDGPHRDKARSIVVDNAIYWLDEFHFDGIRLDAIHYMFDDSEYSIQQEVCDRVREFENRVGKRIHLIGEANIYDHQLIVDTAGNRHTYSAIWADDLMHAVLSVADAGDHLTPRTYAGANDVEEALTHGYLYQGPEMVRVDDDDRKSNHGNELSNRDYLASLIVALQTHDSVGNHPQGKRLHQLAGVEFQKAAAPLFWLYPAIPMMFMGEEFAADSPFMFFADFLDDKLRRNVNRGRKKEYPHHDWKNSLKPCDAQAFFECKMKLPEPDNEVLIWYHLLIELRKRWRSSGLLASANLSIKCDAEKGLFGFSYNDGRNGAFVVSQLGGTSDSVYELGCYEAQILLDSHDVKGGQRSANSAFAILNNQSIAGMGQIEI